VTEKRVKPLLPKGILTILLLLEKSGITTILSTSDLGAESGRHESVGSMTTKNATHYFE
jgi:hypothetical protein